MNKKVSIIIPVYNCEKYIKESIQSCLKQTYKNIEVVVVDDCSKDNTVKIVENINDDRIILLRNERNVGVGKSRNTGVRRSTGDYIAFLDGDDYWSPRKIETGVSLLSKDRLLVYTPRIDINNSMSSEPKIDYHEGKVFKKLLKNNFITTSSVIFDRTLLSYTGLIEEDRNFQGYEDYIFNLKASLFTETALDTQSLTYFRIHSAQTTLQNKNVKKDTFKKIRVFLKLIKYKKTNLQDKYYLLRMSVFMFLRYIIKVIFLRA